MLTTGHNNNMVVIRNLRVFLPQRNVSQVAVFVQGRYLGGGGRCCREGEIPERRNSPWSHPKTDRDGKWFKSDVTYIKFLTVWIGRSEKKSFILLDDTLTTYRSLLFEDVHYWEWMTCAHRRLDNVGHWRSESRCCARQENALGMCVVATTTTKSSYERELNVFPLIRLLFWCMILVTWATGDG